MSVTVSAITLRALQGEPLADEAVRRMVVATAHAIAERQGVPLKSVSTTTESVTLEIERGRIEALGFAAELRRLTTAWYTGKHGTSTLWGEATDEGESWKR